MPRYFFDLVDAVSLIRDEEGSSWSDDLHAHQHAAACARDIIAHDVVDRRPVKLGSYIALRDRGRAEIGRIYFRDVVQVVE